MSRRFGRLSRTIEAPMYNAVYSVSHNAGAAVQLWGTRLKG